VANQIISDLIRIAIQQAIIKPIAGALFGGAPIGGFAAGGSFMVGGRPGLDQNLLSLNGQPVARVGRGERVSVTPRSVGGPVMPIGQGGARHFHINVDARNSVTPAGFAEAISRQVLTLANQMDERRQTGTLKQVPGVVARQQRYGTT